MKILVTGSNGFVGRNLVCQLKNIRDGKARYYGDLTDLSPYMSMILNFDTGRVWSDIVVIVTSYSIWQE